MPPSSPPMEGNNNEIIDKLKENVIAKLDELDSSKKHDSTLIDYILVMVVNQKSKFEMKHNLSLFLGKIVDDFVNWLFEFLADLKMKAIEGKIAAITQEKLNKKTAASAVLSDNSDANREAGSGTSNGNTQMLEAAVAVESAEAESNKMENISPRKTTTAKEKRKLRSAISYTSSDDQPEQSITSSGRSKGGGGSESKERTTKKRSLNSDEAEAGSYTSLKKRAVFDNSGSDSKKKQSSSANKDDDAKLMDLDDASKENETKFLVTLDGVNADMFKDNDGLFLLDEDFDPELMNEDLSNFNHKNTSTAKSDVSIKENNNANKSAERCKYWPACLNGPKCEFFHPVTKCNTFPYCRFGDKCLYIHPTCKFDSFCTRKDCPFMHTAKPRGPPMYPLGPPVYAPVTPIVTCKYFPNCMKPACEFYHPKVCHFGAACKNFNCPFVHTQPPIIANGSVPRSSKFKWSSSKKDAEMEQVAMNGNSNNKEIEI